jgi:hypothetical protein
MSLDDAGKLLAFVCIVLAGRTGNRIPLDRDYIQQSGRLQQRPDVRPLIKSGLCRLTEHDEELEEEAPLASPLQADASTLQPIVSIKKEKEKEKSKSREEEPKSYVRPTLNDVSDYCITRQNQVDPAKWLDYYTSNGWRVGRNPMKDWRAAVRTWERNGYGGPFDDGHKTSAQLRNERNAERIDRIFGEVDNAENLPGDVRQRTD